MLLLNQSLVAMSSGYGVLLLLLGSVTPDVTNNL